MTEPLYHSLKKLLSLRDAGEIINFDCFRQIEIATKKYENSHNVNYEYLQEIKIEFGINIPTKKIGSSEDYIAIKRAIFFNYIYEKYYGVLNINELSQIVGVSRSNCYNYFKQYKNYEKFYPITKELQNEFNLIIKKYEKD